MTFEKKKVLVVGAGLSGIAAARLLNEEQAEVILYDSNQKLTTEEIFSKLGNRFKGKFVSGELSDVYVKATELLIISPGVPTDLPLVNRFREKNIPIWGEIELAYCFGKGKLVAITGTNGKTTTTALTGEIMKTYFESVFVVGNIGIPYTDLVRNTTDDSITVAEMSSFQLETIHTFRPDVSAILNITPDHLNRHHSMENYIQAKSNITLNQTSEDTCILNIDDEQLRKLGETLQCKVIWFSSSKKLQKGLYLDQDAIIYDDGETKISICKIQDMNIFGKHNYENAMAAIGAAIALGVPVDCIHKALVSFVAVEHRIEYVTTKHGVKYYNDSKGTNPDASIQAVRAMQTKTILIGGGYDKGSEYDTWIQSFEGKIKYLVLLGQTREKIAETARKYGFNDIVMVESMKEAVEFCSANAQSGEAVLLSPCCASWGMFKNYEERGHVFKDLVNAIK